MNKLREVKQIIGSKVNLINKKIDLPELQGYAEEISKKKAEEAYQHLKTPVLVEDTSLCFNSYNALPGPYM